MYEKTPHAMVENCDFGMVFNTHTIFAQQPKWAVHNDQLDYQIPSSAPLPTNLSPNFAQNAAWDENNNLLFYFVDGEIFDKNGNNIWPIDPTTIYELNNQMIDWNGHSECVITPKPNSCDNWLVMFVDYAPISDNVDHKVVVGEYALIIAEITTDQNNNASAVLNGTATSDCSIRHLVYENKPKYNERPVNHLAITKKQYGDQRFLFVTTFGKLNVFSVSNSGVIHNDDLVNSNFTGTLPFTGTFGLRSELELYEGNEGEIKIAAPWVLHHMAPGPDYWQGGFDFYRFNWSLGGGPSQNYSLSGNQIVSTEFNNETEPIAVPKGVEFSENGEYLYFTINNLQISTQNGDPIFGDFQQVNGPNFVVYHYDQQLDYYTYHNNNLYDMQYADYGLGQIELGVDNKIYLVGDNRIATLDDSNDPNSVLNTNAFPISNQLTNANQSTPSTKAFYQLYILVDQIDNASYASNVFNSDLIENYYDVCEFPYTININIPNGITVAWYFEAGSNKPINSINEEGVELLTYGSTCTFYGNGSLMLVITNENGCTWTETAIISQNPVIVYGAAFTANYTGTQTGGTLNCFSPVIPSAAPHVWTLYTLNTNTNQYVYHSTQFTQNPTFSNLPLQTEFKITHQFLLPQNYPCRVNNFAELEFRSWMNVQNFESSNY